MVIVVMGNEDCLVSIGISYVNFLYVCDFQPTVFTCSSGFVGGHVRNVSISSSATGIVNVQKTQVFKKPNPLGFF